MHLRSVLSCIFLIFTFKGKNCAEETECCGGHGTKVSRLSKAFGCAGTASVVPPRKASTRLADDILQAYLVHPVRSEGKAKLLPTTHFFRKQAPARDLAVSWKFFRGNRGVCMTMLALIAEWPLYFARRQSMYRAHGAKQAAIALVMSAVLVWRMLRTIMNEISFEVLSLVNWSKLNWPHMNWHFANLPGLVLSVASAGVYFLFSLERLAL